MPFRHRYRPPRRKACRYLVQEDPSVSHLDLHRQSWPERDPDKDVCVRGPLQPSRPLFGVNNPSSIVQVMTTLFLSPIWALLHLSSLFGFPLSMFLY